MEDDSYITIILMLDDTFLWIPNKAATKDTTYCYKTVGAAPDVSNRYSRALTTTDGCQVGWVLSTSPSSSCKNLIVHLELFEGEVKYYMDKDSWNTWKNSLGCE